MISCHFDLLSYSDYFCHSNVAFMLSVTVKGVNFFGPGSQYVISGSDCGNIFFWHRETEAIVQCMPGDENGVVSWEFFCRCSQLNFFTKVEVVFVYSLDIKSEQCITIMIMLLLKDMYFLIISKSIDFIIYVGYWLTLMFYQDFN